MEKSKMKIAAALVTTSLLGGCAMSPVMQAKQAEFNRTIPTCSGSEDCNAKWEAAQLWVVHNAGWKIQTQSSVLIETYNAMNSSPSIAVRVTKEPLGGGRYQFLVKVWCANMFGCQPDSWDAALSFNREVGRAGMASQPTPTAISEPKAPTQIGRYSYAAENLPEVRACNPYPTPKLNAQGPGFEKYTVACTDGDALSLRCEGGGCRVLR